MITIALDGPSGAGKSSLAKELAKRLNIVYLDTGALYRTIGLHAKECGVCPDDAAAVEKILPGADIDVKLVDGAQAVYLNDTAVGDSIRTPEMSDYASRVSALPCVRAFLLETQRGIARRMSVIMDGRDIGSVVLPDANVKIYLTASAEARAKRRFHEHQAKGTAITFEEVLADINERDHRDMTREISPRVKAADAIELDNGEIDLEATAAAALKIIEEKTK